MKSYSVIKYSILIVLTFVFFALALALALSPGLSAFASEEKTSFENGNVVTELTQMGFDLNNYPKNEKSDLSVFAFVEYGYNELRNVLDDYGLYFYLYNPKELEFDFDSVKSFVQIGTQFDDKGACIDYDKYPLVLVSSAENGRYVKVKIDDLFLEDIHNVVKTAERRYDISGIELLEKGQANVKDYTVATTFYYTGYAKGFAEDVEAESTLACRTVEIDTIKLDVKHTTYKAWNPDNVTGQELATVYFNVPERYFNEYGNLQQIKAEWLYSITDYIYCAGYSDLYNKLLPYVGKEVIKEDGLPYYFFSSMNSSQDGYHMYWYDAYNVEGNAFNNHVVSRISTINWLMPNLLNSKEVLLEYYNNSTNKDKLLSYVDSSKTTKVIDAGTTFDLKGLDSNHSGWEWLWEYLGFTETVAQVNPIHVVTQDDVNLSKEDFASELKVHINDVDDIKNMFNEAGSRTVLFRFSVGDFETQTLTVNGSGNNLPSDFTGGRTDILYRTKLPLYQDFDIIWLGFQRNGKLTIIPAVSDPITVIGTTDPPLNNSDKDWSGDAFMDSILGDDWKGELEEILRYILIAVGVLVVLLLLGLVVSLVLKLFPKRVKVKLKQPKTKKRKSVKVPKV